MQAAARGGYHPESGAGGGGDSNMEFNNLHPNFSTEAPTILSDTRGVDFGPYLARIVYIVRRNWISVIPESARLGEKGRVGVVFEILKDGSVPQLRLVASSGSDPLDRAAVNGIHASVPFPPLARGVYGQSPGPPVHLPLQPRAPVAPRLSASICDGRRAELRNKVDLDGQPRTLLLCAHDSGMSLRGRRGAAA